MPSGDVAGGPQLAGHEPELLNGGHHGDLDLVLLPGEVLVADRVPKGPTCLEMMLRPHDDFGDGRDASGK